MILIKADGIFKNKKNFFPVALKDPICNTNPYKIKLRMLQEGLKCKQLEQKLQSTQRELKINNHKVDHGLNENFIEIAGSTSWKMTPFTKLFWK